MTYDFWAVSDAPVALGESSSNADDVEPGGRADGYSPLAVDAVSLFVPTLPHLR